MTITVQKNTIRFRQKIKQNGDYFKSHSVYRRRATVFGRRTQTLYDGYKTIFNGKLCVIGQNLLISTALQIKGDGCG